MTTTALAQIHQYHEQTKHRPDRYARSLGYMEWSSQPCPFRSYEGGERIELDYRLRAGGALYDEVMAGVHCPPEAVDLASLSSLLRDSLALSAWKRMAGNTWTLRVVPSSGNLHPTEAYLLLPPLAGAVEVPALYHYAPYPHTLERRRDLDAAAWQAFTDSMPPGSFLIGLTSIFWRESWKYGERAFRYCQHDLGHVIAALDCAARLLGWHVRLQSDCPQALLDRLLAVDDQSGPEAESGACLLAVVPIDGIEAEKDPPLAALEDLAQGLTSGVANRLSPYHHHWPLIDQVATASKDSCRRTACPKTLRRGAAIDLEALRSCSARQIIHQRRSAVAFDPEASLSREQAQQIWRRLLPSATAFWSELLPWPACVSLLIQVHRVEGLAPGTYLLLRDPGHASSLRQLLPACAWEACDVPGLIRLRAGDERGEARDIACEQGLAADSCFTVAMLADFESMLSEDTCQAYAQMYWECGALGQICYLEAEAAGARGCGIGCYLDDALIESLGGLPGTWQDLYHFAIGIPVEDSRLRTADPYSHRWRDEDLQQQ
jgi:SagB-type dehydrogenase family enzyme